jgi:hypothetical protein
MKQVEQMKRESLLSFKPAKITDERFWLIADSKIVKDFGFKPTQPIHPLYFEHEKAIGNIFVELALTGHLTGWDRTDRKLKDDAQFSIDENLYYLEMEMGNHGPAALTEKVVRYKSHFRETEERFHVLFVMNETAQTIKKVFETERTTPHYQACLLSEILSNPKQILGF